jgi:hypothetical protein
MRATEPRATSPRPSIPMTRMINTDPPITAQGRRFCLGSQGGAEWNSLACHPSLNLIFTGELDWCVKDWAGWMTATHADSGKRTW